MDRMAVRVLAVNRLVKPWRALGPSLRGRLRDSAMPQRAIIFVEWLT